MAINLQDPRDAAARGWGKGWPTCSGKTDIVVVTWSNGTKPIGGVRRGISDLVRLLGDETIGRGYHPVDPGCWGYDCRCIAGTSVPSNHSWGLAVDINAPHNPRTYGLHTDMPSWMPNLWNTYGFRWGGDYQSATKDPMHYEFMGTPADAVLMTAKARADFATQPTPPSTGSGNYTPEDNDMFMYLRAAGPAAGHAILVAGGKQVMLEGTGLHANAYSKAGVPYATTKDANQEALYDKAYGPPAVH